MLRNNFMAVDEQNITAENKAITLQALIQQYANKYKFEKIGISLSISKIETPSACSIKIIYKTPNFECYSNDKTPPLFENTYQMFMNYLNAQFKNEPSLKNLDIKKDDGSVMGVMTLEYLTNIDALKIVLDEKLFSELSYFLHQELIKQFEAEQQFQRLGISICIAENSSGYTFKIVFPAESLECPEITLQNAFAPKFNYHEPLMNEVDLKKGTVTLVYALTLDMLPDIINGKLFTDISFMQFNRNHALNKSEMSDKKEGKPSNEKQIARNESKDIDNDDSDDEDETIREFYQLKLANQSKLNTFSQRPIINRQAALLRNVSPISMETPTLSASGTLSPISSNDSRSNSPGKMLQFSTNSQFRSTLSDSPTFKCTLENKIVDTKTIDNGRSPAEFKSTLDKRY